MAGRINGSSSGVAGVRVAGVGGGRLSGVMRAALAGLTGVAGLACVCIADPVLVTPGVTTTTPSARLIGERARGQVPANVGYYRAPVVIVENGKAAGVVFVSEGDLWRVGLGGGAATRLTSHASAEGEPALSPDGQTLAFAASYEGEREVYTMPLAGGLPVRRTYDAARVTFVGWSPDGKLIYCSEAGSTLPRVRMFVHELAGDKRAAVPLAQCSDGAISADGRSLVFTRLVFQGSQTDRYKGGTAQQLWRFALPEGWFERALAGEAFKGEEAKGMTTEYAGTSRRPMWHDGRVYFASDRSGTMNIWSAAADGSDLKPVTEHKGLKVGSASIGAGVLAYQLGADVRVRDLASGDDRVLAITLSGDMDQTRERWVKKPSTYITQATLSPDGSRVAITARGRVFNVPVGKHAAGGTRVVDVDPREGVRYREARFWPAIKVEKGVTGENAEAGEKSEPEGGVSDRLVALSDETGEFEVVMLAADGTGAPVRLTGDAEVLRWKAVPSPDGKLIAHSDKNLRLWVLDPSKGTSVLVIKSEVDSVNDFAWSPDGRYIAHVTYGANTFQRVSVWDQTTGQTVFATSDRYDSYSPAWSADGAWLYFVSDRTFESLTRSPWGPRAPEPFLDKPGKIYGVALKPGAKWPFVADDELQAVKARAEKKAKEKAGKEKDKDSKDKPEDEKKAAGGEPADAVGVPKVEAPGDEGEKAVKVEVVGEGLMGRLYEVPVEAGNYSGLLAGDGALFWMRYEAAGVAAAVNGPPTGELVGLKIGHEAPKLEVVAGGLSGAELSLDRSKLLLVKPGALGEKSLLVIDAKPAKAELDEAGVDLSGWSLSVQPREEWRQMLIDAWRMLRDYFYDRKMHGADWRGVLEKYLPLVERVRSRDELNDVLAQMTGELSALHHFVVGGDMRRGEDRVSIATLGADLSPVEGGWRVDRVIAGDVDEPQTRSPLSAPGVDVVAGDVIEQINGRSTVGVNPHRLLRQQAGRQVLLTVRPGADGAGGAAEAGGASRRVIVEPLTAPADDELRYRSWEVSRRELVDKLGEKKIGYVHLRAMGREDFAAWARDYYPVFNRAGLVIDVRDNNGGNIDSWILSRLVRKAWMFWNQPVGRSDGMWNMQYAFRGHMVVLCNESTASDGEAFTEGFRRLGLGKSIGTRTWGGGIWLSFSNELSDKGIASAGEYGSFGLDGLWLVEGEGVTPDVVLDNLPHESAHGRDAQIEAAVEHLKKLIAEKPVELPGVPAAPVKAVK